jgi:hypothetical protein
MDEKFIDPAASLVFGLKRDARTNYVVTVNAKGQRPQVFNGFFVATDSDSGGVGAGRQITTFSY